MATVEAARADTIGQSPYVQFGKLREYGCDEVFEEKRFGRIVAFAVG